MPQKSVSHLLLATSLTLVAAGAFGVLHAPQENASPYLADLTDEEDGVGWCCPDFGEVCVASDTAFTCAYTEGGILFSETKEGCQAQCTPNGLSSSSAASGGGNASAAASAGASAGGGGGGSSAGAPVPPAPPPVVSSISSISSSRSSATSVSSAFSFSAAASLPVAAPPFPVESWYACCTRSGEFIVGQMSWAGFEEEYLSCMSQGGEGGMIDADMDEYWAAQFDADVAACVPRTAASSRSSSLLSSSSSVSSSRSSHSSRSVQSNKSPLPTGAGMVCDRRLGAEDACYSYIPRLHQRDLSMKTLFLGDLATQNICSAVCPSLRTLAMCALEAECGPADANLCAQEGGFPIGFLTRAEALAQGYDDPDVEAEDTCLAWRCQFFGAGC